MNANEFQTALAAALGLCRAAAAAKLPIEEMLDYVADAQDPTGPPPDLSPDDVLIRVIEAAGVLASVGEHLPPEPTPIRVPSAPASPGVPMPTNLTV